MRYIILSAALIFSLNLFSQSIYKSSEISFYYPDNYKISEKRLIQNVDVKLIPDDNSHNLIITEVPKENSPSSIDKIKIDDFIDAFKSEIRYALRQSGMTGKISVPKIERKKINNKEFISFLVSTKVDAVNYQINQLVYVYVKDQRQFNFIASGETGDYSSVLNYIIKNFELE